MKKHFTLFFACLILGSSTFAQQQETYDYANCNREMVQRGVQAILMCNGLFTSERSLDQVFQQELAYLKEPIGAAEGGDYEVDWQRKAVAIGKPENGIPTMRAAFREGLGCVILAPDQTFDDIGSLPILEMPPLPGNPAAIPWPDGDLIVPQPLPGYLSQAALQARARNLNGAPRNMNITSVISQDNIILQYKFADEENTYQLNNSTSVNVVINDIRNLLEDASEPQRRYRLTDLEAVEITIFSPQSIGELRLIDVDQEYGGEWGSPLNIIYNSLPQPERIEKGAIRSLAFTLLKMQAIQKMFNNRGLNSPVFNFRIGENSENKEISIELKVKKDY